MIYFYFYFLQGVVGIKWECLHKMPATVLAHTCAFPLCVHMFSFSFSSFLF